MDAVKNNSDVEITEDPALFVFDELNGSNNPHVKKIDLLGDELVIVDDLPGVYVEGIQYYDLKNIGFINSTGMAKLIKLLKSLLKQGVSVQFVNVNQAIKNKIKLLGLDHILICI